MSILFPGTGYAGQVTLRAANIVAGRYQYTDDLLKLEDCTEDDCLVTWPVYRSPVHLANWTPFLASHPDGAFAAYIQAGLTNGFHIGFDRHACRLRSAKRNHPSALANPPAVQDFIFSEQEAGRLVGPLRHSLVPLVHTSPIGLVPKSHQPNKWRTIVDLSFPRNGSVNDGISPELASISYASLDDAVEHILRMGKGAELVKLDLKNAYRIVPIHPQDHHLLAISWEGRTYVDRSLPFGLRSAPKIFSAVADMIAWVLHCSGIQHQIHYLDDFLFIGAPNTGEGQKVLATALGVLQYLGVPVAIDKTEGPSTCLAFLGILIDTQRCELRLPEEKIRRLRSLLEEWGSKKRHTRGELESLLGHLSHAASVIRPGRTFLRQLFNLLRAVRGPDHFFVRPNSGARADLTWWTCFLQSWNGSSFFPPLNPAVHVYSDASGSFGCGAVVDDVGWFQVQWPGGWKDMDITAKELVPVAAAAGLWGRRWTGQHVCFHSDNMAVVAILNSRTAKTPILMHLLRCFSFYAAYFRFHFSATHVPGALNTAADAISRNLLSLFSSLVPQAPQFTLPPALDQLLIATRPDWGSPDWTQLFAHSLNEESPGRH